MARHPLSHDDQGSTASKQIALIIMKLTQKNEQALNLSILAVAFIWKGSAQA
jgi:hypothetical protein